MGGRRPPCERHERGAMPGGQSSRRWKYQPDPRAHWHGGWAALSPPTPAQTVMRWDGKPALTDRERQRRVTTVKSGPGTTGAVLRQGGTAGCGGGRPRSPPSTHGAGYPPAGWAGSWGCWGPSWDALSVANSYLSYLHPLQPLPLAAVGAVSWSQEGCGRSGGGRN